MKIVITLNQQGLLKNSMAITGTGYTLTAMYSELGDIMKDAVSYYKDILADTYYEVYEDVEDLIDEEDDDISMGFIEMPFISGAIEDIQKNILLFKDIFESQQMLFDPMIFVCIEGPIAEAIVKDFNKFFINKKMDLEAIDYLKYCEIETMDQIGHSIRLNFNVSMFYKNDSLLSAYEITRSLINTSGVYDMGY